MKEDRTVSKRTSDTDFLIARINDADEKLQDFAGSSGFNVNDYDESRARDIVDFAAQEDSEIMTDGTNGKIKEVKKHVKKPTKLPKVKHLKNLAIESSSDDVSPVDTGFFMTDEMDGSNITFVNNTSSEVDNQDKEIDTSNKSRNVSMELETSKVEKNNVTVPKTVKPDDKNNQHHHHHSKLKEHKQNNKKQIKQLTDKQDLGLIDALNKSDPQFGRHHSGSVWVVNQNTTTSAKHIHVPGEPGVQIDLYITSDKGEKSKTKVNVRKANTPSREAVEGGIKKYVTNQNGNTFQADDNPEDVVNLNGALSDQEKQIFGVPTGIRDFNNEKNGVSPVNDLPPEHTDGKSS